MPFVPPSNKIDDKAVNLPLDASVRNHPMFPNHKADGTFSANNRANHTGENGMKGWMPLKHRMAHVLDKYSSEDIRGFIQDPKKLATLPLRDAVAIGFLSSIFTAKGARNYISLVEMMDGKKSEGVNSIENIQGNVTIQQIFVGELPNGIVET